MSNALAIAGVTAVLKNLLDDAMINHSLKEKVPHIKVSTLPPESIKSGISEERQIKLFLYHITTNSGWSNIGLPSRNHKGERITNSPLALDLYYLLTAYGKNDFEAETLLGYAMQRFHETPVLTRDAIRTTLNEGSTYPLDNSILTQTKIPLTGCDLAEQVELIKITPQSLNIDEISKLWSAFQAQYRPSFAYHVSVVLIESTYPSHSPLPVLTRGLPDPISGTEEGIRVQSSMLTPYPILEEIVFPNKQPAVRLNELITLHGHHLNQNPVSIRFEHLLSGRNLELSSYGSGSEGSLQVQLPQDPDPAVGPFPPDSPLNPDNWQIGAYTVTAIFHSESEEKRTNSLPLLLAPKIKQISANRDPITKKVFFSVICSPIVRPTQKATLIVDNIEIVSDPIKYDPKTYEPIKPQIITFSTHTSVVTLGRKKVRFRVDSVESILIDRSFEPPQFDPLQFVDII